MTVNRLEYDTNTSSLFVEIILVQFAVVTRVKSRNVGNGAASALVILKPVECTISYDPLALILEAQHLPYIYTYWIQDVGRTDPDNINKIVKTATNSSHLGGWSNVLLQHSIFKLTRIGRAIVTSI